MTSIFTHCYTRLLLLPLLLACIIPSTVPTTTINNNTTTSSYHQYVNTFIGSGGSGFGSGGNNPGAQVPFGAIRLGPDSTSKIFDKGMMAFRSQQWSRAIQFFNEVLRAKTDDMTARVYKHISAKLLRTHVSFEGNSWNGIWQSGCERFLLQYYGAE